MQTQRTIYRTSSDAETVELGRRLAHELPARGVVLLIGDLGAGKTTLAKGIVSGLGAASADEVSSPTFTLIHEYGEGRAYHVDLYRLDEPREVASLGLEELFDRDALVLIEWGERFPQLLPASRTEIRIRALGSGDREFEISSPGPARESAAPARQDTVNAITTDKGLHHV